MKFLHMPDEQYPKNKTAVGETYEFEGKTIIVERITNNYVYLVDGRGFPRKLFDMWSRTCKYVQLQRNDLYHSLERIKYLEKIKELDAAKEKLEEKKSTVSLFPVNAMRFIILELYDDAFSHIIGYPWLFANKPTSHSNLEEDYTKEHPNDNFAVMGGGFYCFRTANARNSSREDSLDLFGKSDTYGLSEDSIITAFPSLSLQLKGIKITLEGRDIESIINEKSKDLPF